MIDSPEQGGRRTSRRRYREFVRDYKQKRLDDTTPTGEPAEKATPPSVSGRREHLRAYLRWLRPHRAAVVGILLLSLVVAGLEMVEPLFMRFMVDRVLLATDGDTDSRLLL